MNNALVQTRQLCRHYDGGRVKALQNADISVKKGDFVAIVGPSGCGKTTLLNLIGAIDIPTSGEILFEGEPLGRRDHADFRSRNIGFVFQSYHLLPALNVLDNVLVPVVPGFWRRGASRRTAEAKELLGTLGLQDRAHNNVRDLSGGEKQRVAIARALINHPRLVLADEPTGNLDSENGRKILEIFRTMNQKDGMTIIMVTHDGSIGNYAGRIITMRDGKIAEGDE